MSKTFNSHQPPGSLVVVLRKRMANLKYRLRVAEEYKDYYKREYIAVQTAYDIQAIQIKSLRVEISDLKRALEHVVSSKAAPTPKVSGARSAPKSYSW